MEKAVFKGIQNEIAKILSNASRQVYIAVAWFTNEYLFEEVMKCLRRGVPVKLIIIDDAINRNEYALDFSQFIDASGELFFANAIKVHHKFCIIDNTLITGSYNWTYYAETFNAENIIVSDNPVLVQSYEDEFENLLKTCQKIVKYESIKLEGIEKSALYDNYSYLCNDLILKKDIYKDIICEINEKKTIEVKVEKKKNIKCDNRGIPILEKRHNSGVVRRLINISLERVPMGRLYSGRKYVRANYISSDIWVRDIWVDIFDIEYVNAVARYFHKKDGGTLDDNAVLPPIPEEIYNPRGKFMFKLVSYIFYKYGKNGNKRRRIGKDGNILQKDGHPYLYDSFHTLIRYDKQSNEYIGFKSMTELCHLIVQSLFVPNTPDDYDTISDFSCINGVYKATIDDFVGICGIEETWRPNSESISSMIKNKLTINPDGVWLLKKDSQIIAYAYGFYTNNNNYNENMTNDSNGEWYVLKRLKASIINYETDKYGELLSKIIMMLKKEGRKGIVYKCPVQSIGYFEKFGFKRENPFGIYENNCIMRLVFD